MAKKGVTLRAKLEDGIEYQLMPKTRVEMVENSEGENLLAIIPNQIEQSSVLHNKAQTLTDSGKQARKNIEAVGVTATYGPANGGYAVLEFKGNSIYPETLLNLVKDSNGVLLTDLLDSLSLMATSTKEEVDKFLKDASFADEAKDTLKELQEYINSDVAAGAQLLADINVLKNIVSGLGKNVVLYTKQELDPNDKIQARNNIGAAGLEIVNGVQRVVVDGSPVDSHINLTYAQVIQGGKSLETQLNLINAKFDDIYGTKPNKVDFRTINGRSIFKVEGESDDLDLGNIVQYSEIVDL